MPCVLLFAIGRVCLTRSKKGENGSVLINLATQCTHLSGKYIKKNLSMVIFCCEKIIKGGPSYLTFGKMLVSSVANSVADPDPHRSASN